MADPNRPPDPFADLKKTAPRTGPPVQKMGGYPAQPASPQPQTFQQPVVSTTKPGPEPSILRALRDEPAPAAPAGPAPVAPAPAPAPAPVAPAAPPVAPAGPMEGSAYNVIARLGYMPQAHEVEHIGPGEAIGTKWGDIHRNPETGALELTLNETGQATYQAARTRVLANYGYHPAQNDPAAPQPPVEPGLPNFNPWVGWVE